MLQKSANNNKKKFLAVGLLSVSVLGMAGLSLAYFSDTLTVSGQAKVGTLDLVYCENSLGNTQANMIHFNAAGEEVLAPLALNNVNPGDYVTLDACITNSGNKSTWVKPIASIKISGGSVDKPLSIFNIINNITFKTPTGSEAKTLLQIAQEYGDGSVGTYLGKMKDVELNAASLKLAIGIINGLKLGYTFTGSIDGSDIIIGAEANKDFILNGTGLFAETETGAIADNKINLSGYQLGLTKEAGNTFQGRNVTVNFEVKALQYRNNPTPNWDQAVDYNEE